MRVDRIYPPYQVHGEEDIAPDKLFWDIYFGSQKDTVLGPNKVLRVTRVDQETSFIFQSCQNLSSLPGSQGGGYSSRQTFWGFFWFSKFTKTTLDIVLGPNKVL